MSRPLIDRLLERVRIDDRSGCWEWVGYVHPKTGYGMFTAKPVGSRTAHRWMYEELVGPVPLGLELDHLCRNRRCVCPDHLDPVTRAENIARGNGPAATRMRAAARTHCAQGHEYTPENTGRTSSGARRCRRCEAANHRRRYAANPERFRLAGQRWRDKQQQQRRKDVA